MKTKYAMQKLLILIGMALVSTSLNAQSFGDILTIGDSLTAGLAGNSGGTITCAALGGRVIAADQQRTCRGDGREGVGGWQPRLKALANASVYNYGSSSETTGEMVARLPAHLGARSGEFVLILGGTNDMIRGVSVAQAIANLSNMIQRSIDAGRVPIIATAPPLIGGRFNSSNSRILQLNAEIRQLPERFESLQVAEIYNQVVGSWGSLNSGDTIHFGSSGNVIVADIWFAAMEKSRQAPERDSLILAPILQLLLDDAS
ncbi:GDSL-type esterase/lipase family protein [Arenicella sp. 4NH20-0111]|uniref:SGNH/GDSL hydrolase family protein n=1 Tax=Arenicella sp. 4NH20-0111 TaxID=3127648 RepID=UPI003340EF7D